MLADALAVAENLSFDIVHAHDFTTLDLGHALARAREVPLVYDAHELWSRRFRVGHPTPLQTGRDRRRERRLGSDAAAVITIGEDLADRLVRDSGWGGVEVVRNTFDPIAVDASNDPPRPHAAVYAAAWVRGQTLDVAAASRRTPVPISLQGPAAPGWLRGFDVGACSITPAQEAAEVTATIIGPVWSSCLSATRATTTGWRYQNKLFQAVAAGVPLVAADVGALAAVVRSRGIGTLYRPGDVASLGVALQQAVENFAGCGSRWTARPRPSVGRSTAGAWSTSTDGSRGEGTSLGGSQHRHHRPRRRRRPTAPPGGGAGPGGSDVGGGRSRSGAVGTRGQTVRVLPRMSLPQRALVSAVVPWRTHGRVLMVLDPDLVLPALVRKVLGRWDRAHGAPTRWVIADVHEDYLLALRDRRWARGPDGVLARAVARLSRLAARATDLTVVADDHVPPHRARHRLVHADTGP